MQCAAYSVQFTVHTLQCAVCICSIRTVQRDGDGDGYGDSDGDGEYDSAEFDLMI